MQILQLSPKDLRAMLVVQLVAAQLCTNRPKFTNPLTEVDDILAELERTEPAADADLKAHEDEINWLIGQWQRLQPGGSPPLGGHRELVQWIRCSVAERLANQSACLEATVEENRRLKDEACRYYLADGTFKVFEPEVALEMRKGAAREMKALQDRLSQAIDTCHTLDLRVQEQVNEIVNLRRKLDGTPDGVWVLESEHNRVMGKLAAFNLIEGENRGLRARLAAIDAAKAGEPPMPAVDGYPWDVDIKGLAAWGRQGWDAAAALRVQLASMKCMDEEAISDLQVIGARKERERIAHLLASDLVFPVVACEFDPKASHDEMVGGILGEAELLKALEPKKEVADEASPF